MSDSAQHQALLDDLAGIARQIEAHKTAVWLLEEQQRQVRERLIASGWKPEVPA